ncbi:MAG: ComF family protein [Candidatus Taylorbacteria bacterium]|nr:ComF family protein [Candidatus Taylorbacteria bacterium]
MTKSKGKAFSMAISAIFEYALDTIAPPDPLVRKIERMGSAEFARLTEPSSSKDRIASVTALFSYKDRLARAAILEVKSYGNKKVAHILGEAAYEYLLAELSDLELFENFDRPILTAIPMTRRSLRKRGWNQCDLIARGIALVDEARVIDVRTDLLEKVKETKDQVGRTRKERLENLKGAFAAKRPEEIRGRNVIVLDDIATTGATLGEAKRALLRAGAKKVWCVALAH